jgi:hypothetical protein
MSKNEINRFQDEILKKSNLSLSKQLRDFRKILNNKILIIKSKTSFNNINYDITL